MLSLCVMVPVWIQVQNKMEDKAQVLSNQSRERFHMWKSSIKGE